MAKRKARHASGTQSATARAHGKRREQRHRLQPRLGQKVIAYPQALEYAGLLGNLCERKQLGNSRRAEYDAIRERRESGTLPIFEMREFLDGIEGETNRRLGILALLEWDDCK